MKTSATLSHERGLYLYLESGATSELLLLLVSRFTSRLQFAFVTKRPWRHSRFHVKRNREICRDGKSREHERTFLFHFAIRIQTKLTANFESEKLRFLNFGIHCEWRWYCENGRRLLFSVQVLEWNGVRAT